MAVAQDIRLAGEPVEQRLRERRVAAAAVAAVIGERVERELVGASRAAPRYAPPP